MIKIEPEDIENSARLIEVKIEDVSQEYLNEDIQLEKNNESVDKMALDEIKIEIDEHTNEELNQPLTSSNNENGFVGIKVEINNCLSTESVEKIDTNCSKMETKIEQAKSFHCEICNKSFADQYRLEQHKYYGHAFPLEKHEDIHKEMEPFNCEICQKTFRHKINLKRHLDMHAGIKFKCKVCDKMFTRNSNLQKHLETVHEGIKSHKCEVCGKLFALKCNLKTHLGVHKRNELHECEICGKPIAYKYLLQNHDYAYARKR